MGGQGPRSRYGCVHLADTKLRGEALGGLVAQGGGSVWGRENAAAWWPAGTHKQDARGTAYASKLQSASPSRCLLLSLLQRQVDATAKDPCWLWAALNLAAINTDPSTVLIHTSSIVYAMNRGGSKKRRAHEVGLEDRSLFQGFSAAANAVSQLYTAAVQGQRRAEEQGARQALVRGSSSRWSVEGVGAGSQHAQPACAFVLKSHSAPSLSLSLGFLSAGACGPVRRQGVWQRAGSAHGRAHGGASARAAGAAGSGGGVRCCVWFDIGCCMQPGTCYMAASCVHPACAVEADPYQHCRPLNPSARSFHSQAAQGSTAAVQLPFPLPLLPAVSDGSDVHSDDEHLMSGGDCPSPGGPAAAFRRTPSGHTISPPKGARGPPGVLPSLFQQQQQAAQQQAQAAMHHAHLMAQMQQQQQQSAQQPGAGFAMPGAGFGGQQPPFQ